MPKIIVSMDGVVIQEVQLTQDRTTLGRRPYNDIVIDNLAVSGEHAVLEISGTQVHVEDLNSTNGTHVNGRAVKKQLLQNSDTIEIGKYQIKYVNNVAEAEHDEHVMTQPITASFAAPDPAGAAPAEVPASGSALDAFIKIKSGAAAGREIGLVKVVTTIGKPSVAVAAVTKRPSGFVIAHVEGAHKPTLNGVPIGVEPSALSNGDMLELAGTQMQFVQQ